MLMNVSLSIKAFEERPAQEEGETRKRQQRPVVQNKKTTLNLETQTDSQWLTCLVILNCNQLKSLLRQAFLLVNDRFFDIL